MSLIVWMELERNGANKQVVHEGKSITGGSYFNSIVNSSINEFQSSQSAKRHLILCRHK